MLAPLVVPKPLVGVAGTREPDLGHALAQRSDDLGVELGSGAVHRPLGPQTVDAELLLRVGALGKREEVDVLGLARARANGQLHLRLDQHVRSHHSDSKSRERGDREGQLHEQARLRWARRDKRVVRQRGREERGWKQAAVRMSQEWGRERWLHPELEERLKPQP